MMVEVRAVTLEQESPESHQNSITQAVDRMMHINEASEFPPVEQIRYVALYMEPFSLPFHELVVFLKRRFLQPSSLVESATDIGLVFDVHENDIVKRIHVGPMEAAQWRSDYFRWPPDDLPDTSVFLGVTHEANREVQFSAGLLRESLKAAADWQASYTQTLLEYLKSGEA